MEEELADWVGVGAIEASKTVAQNSDKRSLRRCRPILAAAVTTTGSLPRYGPERKDVSRRTETAPRPRHRTAEEPRRKLRRKDTEISARNSLVLARRQHRA